MRTETPSWPSFWEVYDGGNWEPETKALLERFLSPGSLFIDVGAWIGPVAVWAVGCGADVIAYEPDAVACADLVLNTTGMPVTVRAEALAAQDGAGFLSNPWELGDSRSRLTDTGQPVVTISPATLLEGIQPTLVKLDIEGGELDVLPTLAPLCAERRIPLFVSWHEDWWTDPPSEEVRRSWFDGFSVLEGEWGAFGTLLAIP